MGRIEDIIGKMQHNVSWEEANLTILFPFINPLFNIDWLFGYVTLPFCVAVHGHYLAEIFLGEGETKNYNTCYFHWIHDQSCGAIWCVPFRYEKDDPCRVQLKRHFSSCDLCIQMPK